MKIQSKFMTGLVSRIVKKVLRTKLGCEVDIQLNEFRTTVIDDKTHVHLDLDADLTKEELNKLLKTIFVTVMPSKNFCKQMQRQARSTKMFKLIAVGAIVLAVATEVERRKLEEQVYQLSVRVKKLEHSEGE